MLRLGVALAANILVVASAAAPANTDHVTAKAAEILLQRLVIANVAGMHCADVDISDGEWLLIAETADQVAAQLRLTAERYDEGFYAPAFAARDLEGFCAIEGPKIAPLIKELIKRGGTIEEADD